MGRTDGEVIIGVQLDTSNVDEGLEKIKSDYSDEKIEIVSEDNNKILNKMLGLSKRIGRSFLGISSTALRFLGNMAKVVTKLGAIGIVLGIVALVGYGITKAFQSAIDKDEELRTKLEYLKFSMKSAFENIGSALVNVFKWLVDRLLDIMATLGAIIKLITGFNIFSKATADNFKKANKNASGLKKTLAGFDEVNVLNENGQTGLIGNLVGDISQLDDLSNKVEKLAPKIKKWFLGGDYETLGEAIIAGIKEVPTNIENMFKPIYSYVLEPYLVKPFNKIIKELEPIWQPIKNSFEKTIKDLQGMWTPFIEFITPKVIEPTKNKFNDLKNNLINTFGPFFNTIIGWINKTFGVFGIKLDYIQTETEETSKEIKNDLGGALTDTKKKAEDLSKTEYKIKIDNKKLDTSKSWIDDLSNKLKELTSKTWKIMTSFTSTGVNKSTTNSWLDPIRNALAKVGITLPKLASGGIINLPGKGVPIANAMGGEKGAEGVIPLTNQQAMEQLGATIGKYITINASITNTMNGRVISKELKKINAENEFAFNR